MELILDTTTGAPKVNPPSSERATTILASVDTPVLVNVGPNCHATYTSPLGPIAGAELCCSTPVLPQLGSAGSAFVLSALTIAGPWQVSPPSCVRTTSLCPNAPK